MLSSDVETSARTAEVFNRYVREVVERLLESSSDRSQPTERKLQIATLTAVSHVTARNSDDPLPEVFEWACETADRLQLLQVRRGERFSAEELALLTDEAMQELLVRIQRDCALEPEGRWSDAPAEVPQTVGGQSSPDLRAVEEVFQGEAVDDPQRRS